MSYRLFEPGRRNYTNLIDKLNRQLDCKYRDYRTALTFELKAAPAECQECQQDSLFEARPVISAPQAESLFGPEVAS